MKRLILLLLILSCVVLQGQTKKDYIVFKVSCVELNGEVYHGRLNGFRYEPNCEVAYEVTYPFKLNGVGDLETVYKKAKSVNVTYYADDDNKKHSKNLYGKIPKLVPKSSNKKVHDKEKKDK